MVGRGVPAALRRRGWFCGCLGSGVQFLEGAIVGCVSLVRQWSTEQLGSDDVDSRSFDLVMAVSTEVRVGAPGGMVSWTLATRRGEVPAGLGSLALALLCFRPRNCCIVLISDCSSCTCDVQSRIVSVRPLGFSGTPIVAARMRVAWANEVLNSGAESMSMSVGVETWSSVFAVSPAA